MTYDEKITTLVTRILDQQGFEYFVKPFEKGQVIEHDICLAGLKMATCRFFVNSESETISMRTFSVAPCVPGAERSRMLEASNILNKFCSKMKFILDEDDFDAYYDFPSSMSDDCCGEAVADMILRMENVIPFVLNVIFEAANTNGDQKDVEEKVLEKLDARKGEKGKASDHGGLTGQGETHGLVS